MPDKPRHGLVYLCCAAKQVASAKELHARPRMVTRTLTTTTKCLRSIFHKDFTMSALRPQMTETDSATAHNPQSGDEQTEEHSNAAWLGLPTMHRPMLASCEGLDSLTRSAEMLQAALLRRSAAFKPHGSSTQRCHFSWWRCECGLNTRNVSQSRRLEKKKPDPGAGLRKLAA